MLLEVILAISLVSIIAVSLTVALKKIGDLAAKSQMEMAAMRGLESYMTEALRNPELEEMDSTLVDDTWGIEYRILVEPMEMKTSEDVVMTDMFRIEIRAIWRQHGVENEEVMETFRYLPLYATRR